MINWNDIHVEQKIAQERYQPLIQARQLERILAETTPQPPTRYQRLLAWLGRQFIQWGQRLQERATPASDGFQGC